MAIPNIDNFEGQKLLHEAKKRDHLRSKLRQGLRDRAWDKAGDILVKDRKRKKDVEHEVDKKNKRAGYDDAMESVMAPVQRDKSVKRMVL